MLFIVKRYTFWFSAAILFQFATAILHAFTLFATIIPENETERQMLDLVGTYKMNADYGFAPTFGNVFTAFSSCFSFLCLFAALTNGYLLFKQAEPNLMKGVLAINVAIFGVCFLMMSVFTFLPPIFLTGLIFVNLLVAYLLVPKIESIV